ncbi:NAD(P)H-binding protein [Subtercola endophyticus]|uniref:NAD(P)H-binding protein n=1 Tax=Subtercola endophyticus TaxID=2895559 RepID=UPI001E53B48F|nr:NAD(P)H-binding protein [Subtercola endophyticus]UFS60909.1 NAD(P)H-binding protein [Subtercola endophyticus]
MQNTDLKPTLVMGARAGIGRLILDQLLLDDMPVRASTRRPEPGQLPTGVEVVAADLTDRASLDRAFEGIGQAFVFANHDGVDGLIEAARSAGVERLVLLSSGSVIHSSSRGNRITEKHRQVEQSLFAADDLTVIPVRPLVLATNSLGWAYPIRSHGTIALYRPEALTAPIDERDIAAVAVAALHGRTDVSDLLTGSERLSQRAQVAAISAAIGRPITVTELSREQAATSYGRFMPEWEAEAVLQFLDDADDGNSPATGAVQAILGKPALSYTDWASRHADDFREVKDR